MIWFLANWRLVAKIAAGIALLVILGYAVHRYNQLIRAEAELEACRAGNAQMAETIKNQNAAIDALQAEADKRKKVSADRVAEAAKSSGLKLKQADEVLNSQPLTTDLCESARLRLLRGL